MPGWSFVTQEEQESKSEGTGSSEEAEHSKLQEKEYPVCPSTPPTPHISDAVLSIPHSNIYPRMNCHSWALD